MNRNWVNKKAHPALKIKMGYNQNQKKDKIQWEQLVKGGGKLISKGGHSATQTELKV